MLDGIAVAVAGARIEEAPRILADYLRGQGSKPECAALGFGFRLAPVPAALLNATSMHVLDFEPMWTPATHALSPALAPVLALAELIGAGGREVLAARRSRASRSRAGSAARPAMSSRAISSFIRPAWSGRSARRSRPSHLLRLDAAAARPRDRHRDLALRQPHQQHRHHDQVDPLRLCGLARARIGAARGERLHRRRQRLRQPARLCRHIPAAAFRPRDAAVVSARRSGWSIPGYTLKIFPVQVHDALRHHRRRSRRGRAFRRPTRSARCGCWRRSFRPATGRIPGPGSKASSACNIRWRRRLLDGAVTLVELHRRAPAAARHAGAAAARSPSP